LILQLARLALASVFVVSAAAKLADRPGSRPAIVALGAPERFARGLGWVVIGLELAVAGGLFSGTARVAGAVGALVLLGLFSAVLAANLSVGRSAECRCFGALSTGLIGWSSLARNLLLVSVAGYVAAGAGLPVFATLAAVAGALWLGPGLVLRSRVWSGVRAPAFSLGDGTGVAQTLDDLLARKRPVLLVFSQPGCGACTVLQPDLNRWHARLADQLTLAVVGGASSPEAPDYPVLSDDSGSVAGAYGVTATPSAVLVDRGGRIAVGTARGPGDIRQLVADRFAVDDEPRFSRRTVVWRAARGLASVGALPVLAAACGSSGTNGTSGASATTSTGPVPGRPKSLHVGEVYLCDQTYALCTNAPCVKSKHDPNIVICDCVVKHGYSIGFHTCDRRAPHGTTLYSEFSTELVTSTTRALSCPASTPWANCLDYICELDPHDPSKAQCQCQLVKPGPAFTFGGNCDTRTCSTTIWSGASAKQGAQTGSAAVKAAMKRLGQPLTLPSPCPKA
jgi:peroxiredoxin